MKDFNFKRVGVAIVLAGAGVNASALTLAGYTTGAADTLDVYISGASAQDQAIRRIYTSLCLAGSANAYVGQGSANNNALLLCDIDPARFTAPAGRTKLALHKSSVGGSGNGVGPVNGTSAPVSFLVSGAATTAACAVAGSTITLPNAGVVGSRLRTFTQFTCNAGGGGGNLAASPRAGGVSDIGFSDVEAGAFGNTTNLTSVATNDLVFGIPVTVTLRNDLQDLNIDLGSLNADCDDSAANRDLERCIPNMTESQVRGIMGGILPDTSFLGLAAANNINVCRRVGTSGSQKITQMTYFKQECGSGLAKVAPLSMLQCTDANAATTCTVGTQSVNQGSGTSNVIACLNAENTAGRRAIGLFSTETVETAAAGWRYIKVGGGTPTLLDTVRGANENAFFASLFMQRKANEATPGIVAFFNALNAQFEFASNIADINADFVQPFGPAGYMVSAVNSTGATPPVTPITEAAIAANPVNTLTHNPNQAQSFSNCQQPVQFWPGPSAGASNGSLIATP